MRRIVAVAKEGESRGTDGAVFCDEDTNEIGYLLLSEFNSFEFREKLGEMLSELGTEYLFVVNKSQENFHVWTVPRMELMSHIH